jgi:ABC-type uncharacterized transport system involved in gliding motility auxiliary subunit
VKTITRSLNYISIILLILGFALLQSYGKSNFAGILSLILGGVLLVIYLLLNVNHFREKNSRMNFLFASNIIIIVLLIVAIVGVVNYLGTKIHQRFDLSEGRIYSLSDQSIKVVRNLNKGLQIKAFFTSENPAASVFASLMDIYTYYSDKLKVDVINPDKNPSVVKTYQITADGTIVFEYGIKETRIEEVSEEAVTNAIIKVTRKEDKIIYFLQGHGEPDPNKKSDSGYSIVKTNLENLSYRVKNLWLVQEKSFPKDISALVVAGPRKPLFDKEIQLIEDYIFKNRGRVFFLINPGEGNELKPLFSRLGIHLENDTIVDTVSTVMGGDYFMPVVARYPEHAITKNFNYATFFPLTRSLSKVSPMPKHIEVSIIAATSPNSWGEVNYEVESKTDRIIKNPQDKAGPLDIIAAITVSGEEDSQTRVVISGDSDFVVDKYYYFSANGNLFNNIISWLAEQGDLVAISPKTSAPSTLHLTKSQSNLLFFYTLIILPVFVFLTGIGIWIYRRRL